VSPSSARAGVEATFKVTVKYTSQNAAGCIIYVGANTETADQYSLYDEYVLPDTSGTYTFNFTCTPKAWDDHIFGVYVNISEYPHPDSWNPLDSAVYSIDLTIRTESIELNTTELWLEMGETFQLVATKYPEDSEDELEYSKVVSSNSTGITVDETGLITAEAYSQQVISIDGTVRVSSGKISKSVTVHVVNSYRWKWRDEKWNIDKVPVGTMVLDTTIRDCTGFTLGIKFDEGDLGNWDIYVYDGGGGMITNDNLVGHIYVSSIGEYAYSELSFSKRNVSWILIRMPVSSDGSYRGYRGLFPDLKLINYDGSIH
jgi:hypothetical protein